MTDKTVPCGTGRHPQPPQVPQGERRPLAASSSPRARAACSEHAQGLCARAVHPPARLDQVDPVRRPFRGDRPGLFRRRGHRRRLRGRRPGLGRHGGGRERPGDDQRRRRRERGPQPHQRHPGQGLRRDHAEGAGRDHVARLQPDQHARRLPRQDHRAAQRHPAADGRADEGGRHRPGVGQLRPGRHRPGHPRRRPGRRLLRLGDQPGRDAEDARRRPRHRLHERPRPAGLCRRASTPPTNRSTPRPT